MKIWQKSTYSLMIFALLTLISVTPFASQAKDKGQLKEVVKIYYRYDDLPDFQKKGKPVAQCTQSTNENVNDFGLTGWYMPASGLTYKISTSTLPSNISLVDFRNAIANSTSTWEANSSSQWTYGGTTNIKRSAKDGVNLVAFGSASGGIAVTRTWYWTGTGEVAESDMIFSSSLAWSITSPSAGDCGGAANTYDVQNIATHEFGHQVGLNDLYSSTDRDLTMYGYGTMRELKKDSLGTGDISGAKSF
ncbi:MAG: matrixin family metalloprotease [Patescibacteria group bacterium]|jgi:hypothetical protein